MEMEVLAPVGSEETLTAAVLAGADAVYFGGKRFNARRNADNFDNDSLKQAIRYCRVNGVKSYLTLNILIKDSEYKAAVELVRDAYEAGIDGVIVQDIGLAFALHSRLPELALHASTQLSVLSPAALPLLKQLGFTRVVAARELSKHQLAEFCAAAARLDMEVEVFVHGALCMCVSGQCYFSAFLGGRSANRGLCAGTCRLPFHAEGGTGFDLSLKDLSLLDHLGELAGMGVASLKIEGRMKRPEYVACAVHCFRQAVLHRRVDPADRALLEQVFSRGGFTDGYFTERRGREMFGVRTEQEKQLSKETLGKIHTLYRRPLQKIPLVFSIHIKAGQPVILDAEYNNISVHLTGEIPQQAIHRPLDERQVHTCLAKLGGTPYFAAQIDCELEPGIMLPLSALNALRKQATEQMDVLRSQPRTLPAATVSFPASRAERRRIKGFFARFQSPEQFSLFPDQPTALVGYSLPADLLVRRAESGLPPLIASDPLLSPAAELPRGANDDTKTAALLCELRRIGIQTVVCPNLAAVALAKQMGFAVLGGFGLNIYNSCSVDVLRRFGVTRLILSPELCFTEIQALCTADPSVALFSMCYGRQPLMLTRNCPVQNGVGCAGKQRYCGLTDRKSQHFPVLCTNGFCEILNAKTTNIADCLEDLHADFGYLYFTTETAEDAKNVYDRYCRRAAPTGDFTRGLFKNGVK